MGVHRSRRSGVSGFGPFNSLRNVGSRHGRHITRRVTPAAAPSREGRSLALAAAEHDLVPVRDRRAALALALARLRDRLVAQVGAGSGVTRAVVGLDESARSPGEAPGPASRCSSVIGSCAIQSASAVAAAGSATAAGARPCPPRSASSAASSAAACGLAVADQLDGVVPEGQLVLRGDRAQPSAPGSERPAVAVALGVRLAELAGEDPGLVVLGHDVAAGQVVAELGGALRARRGCTSRRGPSGRRAGARRPTRRPRRAACGRRRRSPPPRRGWRRPRRTHRNVGGPRPAGRSGRRGRARRGPGSRRP